jgi:hypothetical protein
MRNREWARLRIDEILAEYAARGVFQGFSKAGRGRWKMTWHRKQEFLLTAGQNSLAFNVVLPKVGARSPMMSAYRAFVRSLQSKELPEHRRIDRTKVRLKVTAAKGSAGLSAVYKDDEDYAVRKLIAAVHETYLVFLYDGAYYDYLVETFDLDPDSLAT